MSSMIKHKRADHADGCRSNINIVEGLYEKAQIKFPFKSVPDWLTYCRNSNVDIVERFRTLNQVLQTRESIDLMAYTYGKYRAEQGYKSAEPTFAAQYHIFGEIQTMKEVVRVAYDGFKRTEKEFGIKLTPKLAIGREISPEKGVEIANIALDYGGELILELACDESEHPPEKHRKAFEITSGKIKRSCHAGEWVKKTPPNSYRQRLHQNLITATKVLRADSIEHAITLADDEELIKYVVGNDVRIVGCPLSELELGWIKKVEDLRINHILNRDVWYTFDCDDDLFLPDLPEVEKKCDRAYHFTSEQWTKLIENAARPL